MERKEDGDTISVMIMTIQLIDTIAIHVLFGSTSIYLRLLFALHEKFKGANAF